jgi:hypothetical protein
VSEFSSSTNCYQQVEARSAFLVDRLLRKTLDRIAFLSLQLSTSLNDDAALFYRSITLSASLVFLSSFSFLSLFDDYRHLMSKRLKNPAKEYNSLPCIRFYLKIPLIQGTNTIPPHKRNGVHWMKVKACLEVMRVSEIAICGVGCRW